MTGTIEASTTEVAGNPILGIGRVAATVEHSQTVLVSSGGKMFKKIQIDFIAAAFKLLRLLLTVTIWSCHAWVAPTFRLCHGFSPTKQGPRIIEIIILVVLAGIIIPVIVAPFAAGIKI
jgi:hypothetical protein